MPLTSTYAVRGGFPGRGSYTEAIERDDPFNSADVFMRRSRLGSRSWIRGRLVALILRVCIS